uniref:Carboxypeptidase A2-like n=1 Tax=Dermatophagoides pteronyssinus TaxID=6956 RepID=A0A6P6Y6Z7_DERPT|nr:carboxypeptidase A2-like [Dermatophagoides pteronyssinus]
MTVINRQTIKILDQKESIDSIDNHIDSECLTSTTPVTRMTTFTSSSSSLGNKFLLILSIVYLLSSSSTTISSANITTTPVYSLSLAKNFQPKQLEINSETLETINDKYNKIDYTNHSIIKILNHDLNKIFTDQDDYRNHPDDNHEILWYDQSDINNTYAFVRIGPKSLKRVRRDLRYLRQPPVFVTSNLQSWLDAEHNHHHHQPYSTNQKNNYIIGPSSQTTFHPSGNDIMSSTNIEDDDEEDEPIYNHNDHSSTMMNARVAGNPIHYSKLVPKFALNRYYPIAQVNRYLEDVANLRSSGITLFTIGYTHENRPIQAIEILNNPNDPNFLWIDGCTHAREWVTVTTALYIIDQAIYSKIPINFIIVPVLNVDGYVYTWTKDRMWRKNRRPYIGSRLSRHSMPERCTGVDLNRNYDINFGGSGSSKNPCSFLYQGPQPFSEPEVRAASDLLSNNRHRIKMTLSLHSFNQLWSCPNAFTTEKTKDHNHHMRVLRSIQQAVRQQNGVIYDIGPLGSKLYLGSGFMMDWIYHKLGIRDAYLVELRDRGFYGFILPADQIWPTATETWAGIQAAIQQIFL